MRLVDSSVEINRLTRELDEADADSADLLTSDRHFAQLPNVVYFPNVKG
jgi:hypothetical protein